jgi:hypothetical protein
MRGLELRVLEYRGRQSVVLSRGGNLDPEDGALQMKLAQLNAKFQADLLESFCFLAAAPVWFIFGYQTTKEDFGVYAIAVIAAFASMSVTIVCIHRPNVCLEFQELE